MTDLILHQCEMLLQIDTQIACVGFHNGGSASVSKLNVEWDSNYIYTNATENIIRRYPC